MVNFSYWETQYFNGTSDHLIIGAGLTGLQIAIQLKENNPKAKVVVLDRFAWSLGASTRNAGFACFANISEILDDLQHDDEQAVYQLIRDRYKGLDLLRSKFGDANIGFEQKGSAEMFTSDNKSELHKAIDSIQGINAILHQELGLDRVFTYSSKAGLPNAIGMIHNAYEGQLNTGKLYATILRYAQLIGIRIFGGTTVERWERANQFEVITREGFIYKTENLIITTNAFTPSLSDQEIVPARGQIIVSEQVDELPCQGLHHYDHGYYYWRDIDGRILLGGARNKDRSGETSTEFETSAVIQDELKRFMFEQIFGREVRIEHSWSGIMAMGTGQQKTPIITHDNGALVAARLGGMGVALSSVVAERVIKALQ